MQDVGNRLKILRESLKLSQSKNGELIELKQSSINRYDSAHYKAVLRKNSVKVISAKESIAEDSTGILLESLLEGYAEFYSAELSEKVIRGMTENALKCKYNGGGIPNSYVIDNEQYFQIDPLTATVVLEAFKRYADGATIKQIMDFLNDKSIQSYRNKPLRIDCVKRLLKNRRYIGEYKYCDVVQENGVPAIVPKALFDRVGERMDKNKKAPARYKAKEQLYLLTTKLFCGKCGALMVGASGTSRSKAFHQYYKCVNVKNKKGCDKKTVKKGFNEDLVVNETIKMLMDDKLIERLTNMLFDLQKKENTNIPQIKKQLSETEKAIQNMLNAIQQGIFASSTKQRLEELEETKSNLEVSLINEEMQKPILTKEQISFWIHKFRETDVTDFDQRQRLVDSFINAIYLYDDKIILTFNYKDGTKTISLADVECSDLGVGGVPVRERMGLDEEKSHNTITPNDINAEQFPFYCTGVCEG